MDGFKCSQGVVLSAALDICDILLDLGPVTFFPKNGEKLLCRRSNCRRLFTKNISPLQVIFIKTVKDG